MSEAGRSLAESAHGPAEILGRPASRMFAPFSCKRMTLRNRVAMAPMTRWHSPDGIPGPDVARYYRRRARGGVGLIITEGTIIDHPSASGYNDVPAIFGAAALRGWQEVVDAVHAEGAAIAAQLWHVGAFRRPGVGPVPSAPGVGPSAVRIGGRQVVRRLTAGDVREVAASYGRAARVAVELGFDALEVHGAHGYLLDQFIRASSNPRRDHYGGSIENRVRFAAEVVAEIRRQVPADLPLIFRFSQWRMDDYAARIAETPDELGALLKPLGAAGVDIFHVSTRRFVEPAFRGSMKSLARWTRDLTGAPVIAVGSVGLDRAHQSRALGGHDKAEAGTAGIEPVEEGLARGDFDLIAVGRALLADPEWSAKIAAGRFEAIEPLKPDHLKILH